MTDCEAILRRIRSAGASTCPESDPGPGKAPLEDRGEDRAELFTRECIQLGAGVHQARDAEAARRVLGSLLEQEGADSVIAWEHELLRELGLRGFLADKGIADLTPSALEGPDRVPRDELKARAARAQAGITAADWALADTGTLVLMSLPGQYRSVSLLPPVHVAVVDSSRIIPSPARLLRELSAWKGGPGERRPAVTLVTGTSKTADIELNLVRGVHGPGTLHIILLLRDHT